jgi:hypothetical protein
MKYKLVKFNDGSYGARRFSWTPILGGYRFLDLQHPTGITYEWLTPASYCKGTEADALEAIKKSAIKPFKPKQDLGTPC